FLLALKPPSMSPLQEETWRVTRPGQTNEPAQEHPYPFTPAVLKEPGKPPMISASVRVGAIVTSFDTLIGSDEGLKVAVQQAKAAMLYPPRRLHTLLSGPSGVGKTTAPRRMNAYDVAPKPF